MEMALYGALQLGAGGGTGSSGGGNMGLAAAAPLPSALGHGGARCDGSIDLSAVPRGWQEG